MVVDPIEGAEAVVQAGKLVSTISQLNLWETVAVIGTSNRSDLASYVRRNNVPIRPHTSSLGLSPC
jgi:hypothetical protein